MSIKHNILASYVSQIYTTLIGIAMVPMYVRYMGVEAYGLVGFFAMAQAWFQLLDMGLTPTMARETARYGGGAGEAADLRLLLRSLEFVFVAVGIVGGAAMLLGSQLIATHWLKVQKLPVMEVQHSVMLMAGVVSLRWMCGLYRGAITGFERLVWLSGFNSTIASARFILVIPFFIYVGTTPTLFFGYQLALAAVELAVLLARTYQLMPHVNILQQSNGPWGPLRRTLRFSLTIAFTSSIWVMVTQVDKLLLSTLLPLAEYAYFTLAVVAAGGVMLISIPVSNALMPRMANLEASRSEVELYQLYHHATQIVSVIAIPTCFVLAFFSVTVLWAWTGDLTAATNAAPILRLYAIGNGLLVLAAFPYYLQYAKGELRMHVIGNILFAVILIPALLISTTHYGGFGAACTWVAVNAFSFLIWVPLVHRRFLKGLHWQWLKGDIFQVAVFSLLSILPFYIFLPRPETRGAAIIALMGVGAIVISAGALGSPLMRQALLRKVRKTPFKP
ncbi:oligosaccharide flippase family protein [Caenimonas terrae]|uniref:Oligosaccharide flippase family protein n=1 Tax=Caenimonas terrae TaxID=696074 RepID=A0ABW0NCT8_9BURK